MTTLNEPIARRIAKYFCMLGSDHEGEILAAVGAMKRLFKAEGLTFPDIGTVIESCNGAIEERKYSDADAQVIFNRGVAKGRTEQQQAPPQFYDADGSPRWYEIAKFCQDNSAQLRDDWEIDFISDMVPKTLVRRPSEKQGRHLLAIFIRLGGPYDRKACNLPW